MRILQRLVIFIFLVFCFSCEKSLFIILDCADCIAEEPVKTELDINLDSEYYNMSEINIFEGDLEDNNLYASFMSNSKSTTFQVPLNKKFTITATYNVDENKYIVVNSVLPRVKYDKASCENACYYIYDRVVNLRLKYIK